MDSIRIIWQGETPPDQAAAEAQILRELGELMEKTDIGNLVFHTVFLGESMDDASVFVAPNDIDGGAVDAWYSEKTTWTSITEMDDDSVQMVEQMHAAMREGPLPGSTALIDPDDEI